MTAKKKSVRPKRSYSPDRAINNKISRLISGEHLRLLDLFSGCGGISLGFQSAGFDILGAVEIDDLAARSHAENFFRGHNREEIDHHARARDITKIEPEELVSELVGGSVDASVDILVGGPPCQAYARVGRAKLREVASHPQAYKLDPRGNLYLRYLTYVKSIKPLAIVMENVPDIMHYGGHNVAQEVAEALEEMGYDAKYSLINSAFHGVPQMRERVFIIAYRKELNAEIRFPEATHHLNLPSGYAGMRTVALRHVDLLDGGGYVSTDFGDAKLPFAITAKEAIGDLPPVTLHLEGKLKKGARRFVELIKYDNRRKVSAYARSMREWKGFESNEGVKDHVIRSLPRDTEIFRHMEPGTEYPAAHKVAIMLCEQEAVRQGLKLGTKKYEELFRKMVPPYPVATFPNRWWKLRSDFPVRTLMAHIGKDTYSHIHYDGDQGRTISVREAARLQSFPDGFIFSGTMNTAFRQIGNAVPPLMAKKIAESMLASIREALETSHPLAAA